MTNFKQRLKHLKGKMGDIDECNPYATATDEELLALAAEVAADAEQHPENYLDFGSINMLAQVRKVLVNAQAV